jgi:hypothetical protein
MKDTPILSNNINDHFCGGTNIASAFIKLNDILEKGYFFISKSDRLNYNW